MQLITKRAHRLIKYCAKLIDFIKNIVIDEIFIERHKINKTSFTRKRNLPFSTLFFFCSIY